MRHWQKQSINCNEKSQAGRKGRWIICAHGQRRTRNSSEYISGIWRGIGRSPKQQAVLSHKEMSGWIRATWKQQVLLAGLIGEASSSRVREEVDHSKCKHNCGPPQETCKISQCICRIYQAQKRPRKCRVLKWAPVTLVHNHLTISETASEQLYFGIGQSGSSYTKQ